MDKEKCEMRYEMECRPDYGFITVTVPGGETLKLESSAMATMDTNINMKTKFKGGFGRMMTGESIFINEFTAEGGDGRIGIAPAAPGDVEHVYLENETIFLQNSAYVASGMNVEVATKWQGFMKGFFSGEKLFLIKCSGQGDLWFSTYGAMTEVDVDGEYVVDTGHIVAFTDGLDYNVSSVGGYKSLFFSGEGLVCRFRGAGKVWVQTRQVPALGSWIHPYRPKKSDND
ncbi:MAG: TIGR00266 family protein [Lentisphaeria bacterium]